MDGYGYLVPANTKKATLIMGFLRPFDLLIFGTGFGITVILLLILSNLDNTWLLLVACLPAVVTGLLVVPIPNYHNVLVAIQSILRFYQERRSYVWRGWCIYNEYKDDK